MTITKLQPALSRLAVLGLIVASITTFQSCSTPPIESFVTITNVQPLQFERGKEIQNEFTMRTFLTALQEGDTKTEYQLRADSITWWYKKIDKGFQFVHRDSSLATIGYLKNAKFTELDYDSTRNIIMRVYHDNSDAADSYSGKHRYAFHINDQGKIDGILYVPPLTKPYFPYWTEADYKIVNERLDQDRPKLSMLDSTINKNSLEQNVVRGLGYAYCGSVIDAVDLVEDPSSDFFYQVAYDLSYKVPYHQDSMSAQEYDFFNIDVFD